MTYCLFSLSAGQLQRIEDTALRILEELGLAVLDEALWNKLKQRGLETRGERVCLQREDVLEFLDAERRANGNRFSVQPEPDQPASSRITLHPSPYPQHVHNLDTDRIVPFTTERLIEATKLVDALSSRGLAGGAPGCPTDVPGALQPVVQYWVAATYSRHGRWPVDGKNEATVPYIMEMAEALGHPVQALPVYVFSPLTLRGESLRCVLKFRDKLSWIHVSNMASLGCTAPVNVGDAFALLAAEVVGAAILLREVVQLPVRWGIRLCPMDLRTLCMSLGSPEDLLLHILNSQVNAFLHGTRWHPAVDGLHSNAKLPGAQACAEKASAMILGALLGQRGFGGAGTLSLDEVFSPEQLVYDLEIKAHVERLVRGMHGDCDLDRCLRDVAAGIQRGGFVGLETTVNAYPDQYWHPELFERDFLSSWHGRGAQTIRDRARAMVRTLVGRHDYHLEPDCQKALDQILDRARLALT